MQSSKVCQVGYGGREEVQGHTAVMSSVGPGQVGCFSGTMTMVLHKENCGEQIYFLFLSSFPFNFPTIY